MTTTNHYRSIGMVVRELRALGYRRIGFAVDSIQDTRVMRNYYAAYLIESLRFPKKDQFRDFPVPNPTTSPRRKCLNGSGQIEPDVIISSNGYGFNELLQGEGLRIPDDVGLVSLTTSERKSSETGEVISGTDQNFEAVGGAAVDLLLTLMHRNERGIPTTPEAY